jgi:hypothetical protein
LGSSAHGEKGRRKKDEYSEVRSLEMNANGILLVSSLKDWSTRLTDVNGCGDKWTQSRIFSSEKPSNSEI